MPEYSCFDIFGALENHRTQLKQLFNIELSQNSAKYGRTSEKNSIKIFQKKTKNWLILRIIDDLGEKLFVDNNVIVTKYIKICL